MNRRLFRLVFALLTVGSHAEDLFSGEWDDSEHVYLRQVGNKVYGLWSTTTTGRGYEGRLIGTASSNDLKVDWVCGTPGARTATYCADAAPRGESSIGWSPSEVYLLFADERQRAELEALQQTLLKQGCNAPGNEKVRSVPLYNELRYFRSEDQDVADQLVKSMLACGIRPLEAKLVKTVTAARRQQFELWLAQPSGNDPISRLAAQIAADDKDQRLQALRTLKDQHADSPDAIAAVLALLGPDSLDQLSAEGRFNALWFLARTKPSSWTTGLVQTGREATARLRERIRAGVAIGPRTESELSTLEQLLTR